MNLNHIFSVLFIFFITFSITLIEAKEYGELTDLNSQILVKEHHNKKKHDEDTFLGFHSIVGIEYIYDPYEGNDLWYRIIRLENNSRWFINDLALHNKRLIIFEGDIVEVLIDGNGVYSLIFDSPTELISDDNGITWYVNPSPKSGVYYQY